MKIPNQNELKYYLNELKNNAQAMIAVAAILLVVDVVFILRWQFVSLGRLSTQITQLATEVKNSQIDTRMSGNFKTKLEDAKNEVAVLKKMIINEESLPSVIESISKFANVAGVKVLAIRPVTGAAAGSGAAGGSGSVVTSEGKVSRAKITITARCGFHQLGRFVALLESGPVFLDIRSTDIRTDEQDYLRQFVTIMLEVVVRNA